MLSLCCLVFWDTIEQSQFNQIRDVLVRNELRRCIIAPEYKMNSILREQTSLDTMQLEWNTKAGVEPSDFYPVFEYEREDIRNEWD